MFKSAFVLALSLMLATGVLAQKQIKPWNEWSKKEAQKMLENSAWSQTQTETDTSQMFFNPANAGDIRGRDAQAATNQATSVKFRIRFFTARPIRQAFVRLIELDQSQTDEAASAKRQQWANLSPGDSIIVAVAYEGTDRRYLGRVMQAFNSAVTSVLKNSAYLERKDGKRLFLSEYVPPGKDLFGARFIFPRTLDGQPFLTPESGSVRFHAEYDDKMPPDSSSDSSGQIGRQPATRSGGSTIQPGSPFKLKLDMKFKVAAMLYNGELEY